MDTFIHRREYLYHCRNCRSSFLCTPRRQIAGASGIGLGAVFACPACTSALTKLSITRAIELGARTAPGGIDRSATTEKIKRTSLTEGIIPGLQTESWFHSFPEYMTAEISRNASHYVAELTKISGLTSTILLDFLSHIDILGYAVSHQVPEILTSLSVTHPEVVKGLYDALVTTEDEGKAAMMMRLVLQSESLFGLVFCKTTVPTEISGTIDLLGISPTGDITWLAVIPGTIEENAAGSFLNEVMAINPFYFHAVRRIILVGNRFVWTVKQIVARYGTIETQTGIAEVELLEENPLGQFTFVTTPTT